jgi:hypothetical protein
MPTVDSRNEVVRKAVLALVTGNVTQCEDIFTRDVTCRSPVLTATSRDDLETQLSSRADALSGVDVALERVIDGGDTVVAEWRVRATREGAFLVPGDYNMDGRGQALELEGVTIAEVSGRRVSSLRNYFDPRGLRSASTP